MDLLRSQASPPVRHWPFDFCCFGVFLERPCCGVFLDLQMAGGKKLASPTRYFRVSAGNAGREVRQSGICHDVGPPTETHEVPLWDSLEPGVHGPRGRRAAAAVRVGVFSTRHTSQAGSKHGGWAGCVRISFRSRANPREGIFRGLRTLALSTLRLTTLAKTQGGASQRPSALAGPMLLCRAG